jgi:hypothetical protein
VLKLADMQQMLLAHHLLRSDLAIHLLQLLLILDELLLGLQEVLCCAAVASVPQCLSCLQLSIKPEGVHVPMKTGENYNITTTSVV